MQSSSKPAFADMLAASRARLQARDALASSNPRPLLFDARTGTILVHRCCIRAGKWRVTMLEGDNATGHVECETFADAVCNAYQFGAVMGSAQDPLG